MSDSASLAHDTITADPSPVRHRSLLHHLLPLAAYLVVTIIFTWPVILNFATETPADRFLVLDRDQNLWNLWWFRYALLIMHHNPFYNPLIYWPDYQAPGVGLWLHTLQPFNMTLGLVLQQFFNLVTTYNIIIFFAFTLCGYGAYLLVSYVSGNRIAGFVGGLAFACSPYHLDVLRGQSNLFSTEFLPLYLYALLRLRDAVSAAHKPLNRQILAWMVAAALLLSLNNLIDWYLLIDGLLLTGLLLLAYLWSARHQGGGWLLRQAGAVAAVGLLWALLCAPVILATLNDAISGTVRTDFPQQQRLLNASDLLSFITPVSLHTLEGGITDQLLSPLPTNNASCVGVVATCMSRMSYLGFAALTLAVIGAIGWWRRRSGYWLVAALALMVLALGPSLQVATVDTGIPLPFALLVKLPVFSLMRGSNRLLAPFDLCYAVLIGLGAAWLLQRGRWQRWLAGGLSLALAAEFLIFPFPAAPVAAPIFFSQLGQDSTQYAILELPFTGHGRVEYARTLNQVFHQKAIADGYLSRQVDDHFSIAVSMQDWFVSNISAPDINASASSSDTLITMLNAYQFRYVVLYKGDYGKAADLARARTFFDHLFASAGQSQPEIYEDSDIVAYQTPTRAFTTPLILMGENWYQAEQTPQGLRRWMDKDHATLRLVVPPGQAGAYNFSFNTAAFAQPRRLSLSLGSGPLWQQTIPTSVTSYTVQLKLDEGTNFLSLNVLDGYASPRSLGLDAKDYRDLSVTVGGLRVTR